MNRITTLAGMAADVRAIAALPDPVGEELDARRLSNGLQIARRRVPLRRYGDPEEVAQMTLSLCLPAASYLNGVAIPVDGGMLAQNT